MMPTVFYLSAAIIAWVYLGYPLFLWLGAFGARRNFVRGACEPPIGILVAAHNEESTIAAKIRNLLASDYPRERMEIAIGNDGSTDRTGDIIRKFAPAGVKSSSSARQRGKSATQNALAAMSTGAILVLTDADCFFSRTALRQLIEHFADPRVGLVTGRARYHREASSAIAENESLYLRYETWLREQESARGVLAMASGSLFAVRRSLWRPLDPALGDDFVLPLQVARAGMLSRLDTRAVAFTALAQDSPRRMLRTKTRIIAKDFSALLAHRELLNPLRHGPLAAALWSHKLLRWLVPYFLLALCVSSCFLFQYPLFRACFALQMSFYALALAGFVLRDRAPRRVWSLPLYFCVVNLAALLGTLAGITGRTSGKWKPERHIHADHEFQQTAPERTRQ